MNSKKRLRQEINLAKAGQPIGSQQIQRFQKIGRKKKCTLSGMASVKELFTAQTEFRSYRLLQKMLERPMFYRGQRLKTTSLILMLTKQGQIFVSNICLKWLAMRCLVILRTVLIHKLTWKGSLSQKNVKLPCSIGKHGISTLTSSS